MPARPIAKKQKMADGVHPAVAMMRKWIEDLPAKTGKSLEQWLALIRRDGPASEIERLQWLKKKHGLGTNAALWLAGRAEGKGRAECDADLYLQTAERHVEEMFEGKDGLRPNYDRLLSLCLGLEPAHSPR